MSFQKKLSVYLDSWVSKWIIQEEQKLLIQKDISSESSASLFFTIISTIWALFIWWWIILLISANWEHLPKLIKLLLILAMPVISVWGGYYLSYIKQEYKKIWDSFIFLWSLLIWASLALLWQLYHMEWSVTGLLIWWLILSLPLTFILKFKSIATWNIVLFYLILFFSFEDNFYRSEESLLLTFFIASTLITVSTIFIENIKNEIIKQYSSIINVFKIISIKVLLWTLFIWTLNVGRFFNFNFFGEWTVILHHIVFLIVLFWVMWEANRTYNVVLRHITFIWIWLFMIVKYFAWFWSYMNTWIFFVLFGIFLLWLVYAYIKWIKYLAQVKTQAFEEWKKQHEYNNL